MSVYGSPQQITPLKLTRSLFVRTSNKKNRIAIKITNATSQYSHNAHHKREIRLTACSHCRAVASQGPVSTRTKDQDCT